MAVLKTIGKTIWKAWGILRHFLSVHGLLQWFGWWEAVVSGLSGAGAFVWCYLSGLPAPEQFLVALFTTLVVLIIFAVVLHLTQSAPSKARRRPLDMHGNAWINPKDRKTARIYSTVAITLLAALFIVKVSLGPSSTNPHKAPATFSLGFIPPPVALEVTQDFHFQYGGKSASETRTTPCTSWSKEAYSFDDLSNLPGGPELKRPQLVILPKRQVYRSIQMSTVADILIEASVTSRGESTVATNWRFCIVHGGKALFYMPQEIGPNDLSRFEDKGSLEDVGVRAPLERGRAIVGWLHFRIPNELVGDLWTGSLECRDYLGRRYAVNFGEKPAVLPSADKVTKVGIRSYVCGMVANQTQLYYTMVELGTIYPVRLRVECDAPVLRNNAMAVQVSNYDQRGLHWNITENPRAVDLSIDGPLLNPEFVHPLVEIRSDRNIKVLNVWRYEK
jgi:hypothetical protein